MATGPTSYVAIGHDFDWSAFYESKTPRPRREPEATIDECTRSGNVQGFIKAIADINVNSLVYIQDTNTPTALIWYVLTTPIRCRDPMETAEQQRLLMVQHLLEERNASANDQFCEREIQLIHRARSIPMCRLLLKHKADVNGRDLQGRTPLMCAARDMALPYDMVDFLLENKADANLEMYDGKSNSLFVLGKQRREQEESWWQDAYVGHATNKLYQYWKNHLENALVSVLSVNATSVVMTYILPWYKPDTYSNGVPPLTMSTSRERIEQTFDT